MSSTTANWNDLSGSEAKTKNMSNTKSLSNAFKKACGAGLKFAFASCVGAAFGMALFDPFSDMFWFPVAHDPSNEVSQAVIGFMQDKMGFIQDWLGFTGDGGLLQTPFFDNLLGPYYPGSEAEVINTFGGEMSFEDLMDLQ